MTITFPHLTDLAEVKTVYVHDAAGDAIGRMEMQLGLIRRAFGDGEELLKASLSLNHCLTRLFSRGFGRESYVTKETDGIGLSLYINDGPTFVFGMVWFRDKQYDDTPRAGVAGEWSLHS